MNIYKQKLWKRIVSIVLALVIALITPLAVDFTSKIIKGGYDFDAVLSAYAADLVNLDTAIALNEDVMYADPHVIDLQEGDGTNTLYLFSEPISYVDEEGNLKTKDVTVEEQTDETLLNQGYDYTNGQNDYRILFSSDSSIGVKVQSEGCIYTLVPISGYQVTGKEAVATYLEDNFEVFAYPELYGEGTTLRFYPQLNGVKDEIVLNKNIGQSTFSFILNVTNGTAVKNEDGTVALIDNETQKEVQTFATPFAYDSVYVEGSYDEHYGACEYELTAQEDGTYLLTVRVDEEWLNSETTTYPVVIDPTTSDISTNKDAGVYSGKPSNPYGTEPLCCFGREDTLGYGRVLLRFTVPDAIEAGAAINSAYIWMRETTGLTAQTYVRPYMITSSWVEDEVTWNNKPSYNSSVTMPRRNINSNSSDASSPYWYKFDISKAIKSWVDGTATNRGLMFISQEETDKEYQWRAFASKQHSTSSYRPYTVISYTNDATAPTFSVSQTPTDWTNGNVKVEVSNAVDNPGGCGLHSYPYSFSNVSGTYDFHSMAYATYSTNCTVYVSVQDKRGNKRTYTHKITNIDKTAPTITAVTGAPTEWTNAECTLTVNATDTQSGVTQYSFSTKAGTYSWQTGKTYTPTTSGTHYIYAKDAAGNISPAYTVDILYDSNAPTAPVVVSSEKEGIVTELGVTLTATSGDAQSGVSEYSFSADADTYNWSEDNTKTYTSNCTVYVAAKDAVGNISEATEVGISNIDKSTYSGLTLTTTAYAPTNGNATVYYLTTGELSLELAEKPYCFVSTKDGYTDADWQAENSKEYTENQTVYGYLKLADGTIVYKGSIDITMIDRGMPTLQNVSATVGDTETTITFMATDPEHTTIYASIDGGATWELNAQSFTITNDSVNAVTVMVKDIAGNITTKTIDFVQPGFYQEGELIGLYNPVYTVDVGLQYRIGEDGAWIDYKVPFAIPAYTTETVYARTTNSASALGEADATLISQEFTSTGADVGTYTETHTDFTMTYQGVSFDFIRRYDSTYKRWIFSTESTFEFENDYIVNMILPDTHKLTFVKTDAITFKNETYGYTLTYDKTGWMLKRDDISYIYNTSRVLTKVTNQYGHTITLIHSGGNTTIRDGAGRCYKITGSYRYMPQNVTDPEGGVITYTWGSNLMEVVDQAGVTVGEYQYYSNGLIMKSMDMAITYKTLGGVVRVVKYTYNSGAYETVQYTLAQYGEEDTLANKFLIPAVIVETQNSVGETMRIAYNHAFCPTQEESDGNVTEYTYDEYHRVLTEIVDGTTTTYTYDENGNLISQTTGEEETTTYTYDSENRLIKEVSGQDVTYYVYNELDEVVLTATHQESCTEDAPESYDSSLTCFDTISYTYDNGMITQAIESSNGEISTYTYDIYGNVISVVTTFTENETQQTTSTSYTYDMVGNLLSITERTNDEITKETAYTYDEAGRTLLVDEDGSCSRTLYDGYGRTIQEIGVEDYDATKDGLNYETPENTYTDATAGHTYVYDADTGLLTSETDRYGKTTSYTYHTNGNIATETFDIYVFHYLSTGELEKVYTDGVLTIAYTYDSDGNVLTETYANGDVIAYEYTESGELLKQLRNGVEEVTYVYDEETGELTSKTDAESGLAYRYADTIEQIIHSTKNREMYYRLEDTENTTDTKTVVNERHYGVSYTKTTEENKITYSYQNIPTTYETKISTNKGWILSESASKGTTTLLTGTYTYDSKGRATRKNYSTINWGCQVGFDDEERIAAMAYPWMQQNYFYDENDQLIRVNNNSEEGYTSEYTYDDRGNILSKKKYAYTENTTAAMTPTEATTFEYKSTGWVDQLVKVNEDTLTYDAGGNVLTYGDKVFTWERGRILKSITEGENTYSYTYDEDGIRTSKTVNGVTTYFNYIDGQIVSQWNENDVYPMVFEYDTNGKPVGFYYNNAHYLYLTNQMGDVFGITNANGTPIVYYQYDEWGNLLSIETAEEGNATQLAIAEANPLRYRGYYYDMETEYYYLQSRYYDAEICRFINADEPEYLGFGEHVAKWNLFAYCENDPVNCSDYNGHWVVEKEKKYIRIRLNNWETETIAGAVALGGAVLALVLILTVSRLGGALALAVMEVVAAQMYFANQLGNGKGVYIQIGFNWLVTFYVSILPNKKEPSGFNDIWEIFEYCRKYAKKIAVKFGVKRLKKLASRSKKIQICVLAQMLYDEYCGKKVLRKNYYVK